MSEEEGGAEDVSFLRTEDMVTLSCTGTGERVCLSAEGFGNRQCFLESIADKVIFRIIINHIYINDFPVEFLKILILKKKKSIFEIRKKNSNFFSLCYPRGTQGFPQQMSANSVQPFGQL